MDFCFYYNWIQKARPSGPGFEYCKYLWNSVYDNRRHIRPEAGGMHIIICAAAADVRMAGYVVLVLIGIFRSDKYMHKIPGKNVRVCEIFVKFSGRFFQCGKIWRKTYIFQVFFLCREKYFYIWLTVNPKERLL